MQESQRLIVSAYERARGSGKLDWNKMTTAVLKNRLLDLTRGAFDETTFGATSFTDFVLQNDDILHLDRSVFPPLVELREADQLPRPSSEATEITDRYLIRSDLWKAALDYSSGTRYVWDTVIGRATPSERVDDKPTIGPATLELQRAWRKQFRAGVVDTLTEEESEAMDLWINQHRGSSYLPTRLKSRWNGFFCENVKKHLLRWFHDTNIQPPDDFMLSIARQQSIKSADTEALRKLVLSVVQKMTRDELASLSLPSGAVLRAGKSSGS